MNNKIVVFIFFLSIHNILAQSLSPTVINHSGFNYDRLAYIDTVMKSYIDKNLMVGDVVIVVKDNNEGRQYLQDNESDQSHNECGNYAAF
jgi:hypothetical protein